jgi:hypothetical protein
MDGVTIRNRLERALAVERYVSHRRDDGDTSIDFFGEDGIPGDLERAVKRTLLDDLRSAGIRYD